jgi:hypothetical protein
MLAKIIHNLVNTNQQNHPYYGKSPVCPSCKTAEETLSHALPAKNKAIQPVELRTYQST